MGGLRPSLFFVEIAVMRYTIEEDLTVLVGAQAPSYVISTADLKAHLRVTHSDEDSMIEAMRQAAINYVENLTNLRLGKRIAYIYYDDVLKDYEIPIGPVDTWGGLQYANDAGESYVTLTQDTDYILNLKRNPARIQLINMPSAYTYNLSKIKATVSLLGYDAASVPAPLVHAIKLLVSHMYELRQPEITGTITTKLKLGLEALVNPYRIISFR